MNNLKVDNEISEKLTNICELIQAEFPNGVVLADEGKYLDFYRILVRNISESEESKYWKLYEKLMIEFGLKQNLPLLISLAEGFQPVSKEEVIWENIIADKSHIQVNYDAFSPSFVMDSFIKESIIINKSLYELSIDDLPASYFDLLHKPKIFYVSNPVLGITSGAVIELKSNSFYTEPSYPMPINCNDITSNQGLASNQELALAA